mgnify:CR=1 FL=1
MVDNWEINTCFISFRLVIPYKNHPICDVIYEKMMILTSGLNPYDLFRHVYKDSGLVNDEINEESRMGEVEIDGKILKYKRGFTL